MRRAASLTLRLVAPALAGVALATHAMAQDAATAEPEGSAAAASGVLVPAATPLVALADVLELARAVSPLIDSAEAELVQARYRRLDAAFQSLPRIEVNAGIAPAPRVTITEFDEYGNPIPSSADQTDAELIGSIVSIGTRVDYTVTVPLTTFGRIRLARQLANVGVDVAEIERWQATLESVFQAYRAYRASQWYEEADTLLRQAARRLDQAEENIEIDIDNAEPGARTSLRQLVILRAQFAEQRADADAVGLVARHALESVLNVPRDAQLEAFDLEVGDVEPPTLAVVLEAARRSRPDYALLDNAVAAAELDIMRRRRDFAPDIGLRLTGGWAYTPTMTDLSGPYVYDPYNRFSFGVGIGLRWNVNLASLAARVMQADAELASVQAQRDAGWLGIEQEVSEAYYAATGRLEVVRAQTEAYRAAEAWLSQVGFQFDQGLAEYADFAEPLRTFYATAGARLEAVLRYRIALADLAVKCGLDTLEQWPAAPAPAEAPETAPAE